MTYIRTLAGIAITTLIAGSSFAAGPNPISQDAYQKLTADYARGTVMVQWAPGASNAARASALEAVHGSILGTGESGAQLIRVGADVADARAALEQMPTSVVASVQSTASYIGNALSLDQQMLETLTIPDDRTGAVLIPVVLDGGMYTLELRQTSVRSSDFHVLVQQDDGSLVTIETPESHTYRGRVVEMPGSSVAATIDNGLSAEILLNDNLDSGWFIQPLSDAIHGVDASVHVVYAGDATRPVDGICGGALVDEHTIGQIDPRGNTSTRGDLITAEIAFDADYQFYVQNGSSNSNVTNDIENVVNGMNVVYERDCGITFVVTAIVIRSSSASNPYTTNDPDALLSQFRSEWVSHEGGIHRDIAHLMTGRNMTGSTIGIAWLSAVCTSNGYGVSQSRFTGNMNSRIALTSHEVGHNFSAQHCSGGACHIMCAGLGGCGGIGLPNFGAAAISSITSYAAHRGCLDSGPPPNDPPTVVITTPFDGTTVDEGATLFFSALASDPQQGNISDNVVWSSNLDGVFGVGNGFNYTELSVGDHTITATIVDSGSLSDHDEITVHINSAATCTADWNGDDTLDFFDVSGFLDDFANHDSAADLNNDDAFDFFDVSDFLDQFSAGCP